MNRKNPIPALLLCSVLFILALLIAVLLTPGEVPGSDSVSSRIQLSEILASNQSCPAPNGKYLDYIEVYNASQDTVDLSGYMLSDDMSSIGYTFPQGTLLAPGDYALCWCDPDAKEEGYANFAISRSGETIYLYNSANVLIDQAALGNTKPNVAWIRESEAWTASTLLTPGFANTEAGFQQMLQTLGADALEVVISEVMTGNTCTDIGGKTTDWLELYNAGSVVSVLDGCYLSDDPADPLKWQIPQLTLQPGEYALIPCAGKDAAENEADFALPRSGCTVTLTGTYGNTLSSVACPILGSDLSYVLTSDGTYAVSEASTPGYENSDHGYAQWLENLGAEPYQVVISELVAANYSTLLNGAGQLCDWVELYNAGSSAVVLDGCYLSDDPQDRSKWRIPSLTLESGEYAVIPLSGDYACDSEAPFALSRSSGSVLLTAPQGYVISRTEYTTLGKDRSWSLQADGTYQQTSLLSPGFANTQDGAAAYRKTQVPTGELMISEVMPANNRYLQQSDGKYYDWVEITNISSQSINLSGYTLSDDPDKPAAFSLPDKTLAPGEATLIICSGEPSLNGRYTHASFTLSYDECWVYLSDKEGKLVDYLRVFDVPYQASAGKIAGQGGTYYFTKPTPGTQNGTGVASISHTPAVSLAGGIYNDVQSLTVELTGNGEIHYTLDGSQPTMEDPVYTKPLTLTKTTVIRAVSCEKGRLPSDVLTASYIINEHHTMPVISISAEDSALFGANGIYTNYTWNQEIPCNFTYLEPERQISVDCGLKLYGHTALQMPKKNFKVNFRGVYGADVLSFPIFGEDGPEIFDSLCIRAGQDNTRAIIRDEVFASLAQQMGDHVLVQKSKYCIVYVNGEYFGIFALKEAWNETYYSQNKGVSAESVEIVQAPVAYGSEIFQLRSFCIQNDLSIQENYDYVASKLDIESIIDWMIIQGYTANGDTQQNLRYIRSSENGNRWQMAFYDLDWAFIEHAPFSNMFEPGQPWQHKGITINLLENKGFRQQFIQRCSEMFHTVLSDENVIAEIDKFEAILDPEVKRDRQRWLGSYNGWKSNIQSMRNFVVRDDHMQYILTRLTRYLNLTNKELKEYFSDLT